MTTAASVAAARGILEREQDLLARQDVPGTLTLIGGSSLPGLVTKGDIDLHLRVRPADFEAATRRLPPRYRPVHLEIWTEAFATFERDGAPPIGVALTVLGSEHDRRFVRSWQRMAVDAAARAAYNAVKRAGGDVEDAKSRFFDALVDDQLSEG
ncbi:GrpB family protein [Microbacterium sp. BK668]|uniref:GrpB family protein n=1 Tax=Microbacterium sp. BK668 TaxID=2512118 RepID=UPI00105BFDFD|nr:GrpB family protein [Microbacterium sp. BK668]TDN90809.1 GrpB protein [Microbacterium sp. BK668]